MLQWQSLLTKVLYTGEKKPDRTGVGTLSLFGEQLKFDNSFTFPAVTTKQLFFKQVCTELACFVRGLHSLEDFHKMGCNIWDINGQDPKWANGGARFEGDLGRIYGVQWRQWVNYAPLPDGFKEVDQLKSLVEGIKADPFGRRHVVCTWHPGEEHMMCLPPCPLLFQVGVRRSRLQGAKAVLDMRVDMRSVDLFLGLPFDIASYAVLQRLIALETGMISGNLIFQLGDAHIYNNHIDQVKKILERPVLLAPVIELSEDASLFGFLPDHVRLINYNHHGPVMAPMNN